MPNPTIISSDKDSANPTVTAKSTENMPNLFKQHRSFLFSTDLEPDDIFAFMCFMQQVEIQAAENPSDLIKVAFLVGEYESSIKVARMEKMIELYRKSFQLPLNISLSVLPGYSDFTGSQKKFTQDGIETLSEAEIKSALEKKTKSEQSETLIKLRDYLVNNSNTLVISLKPMRELLNLEPETLAQHVFAGTGSYNFRACWGKNSDGTQKPLEIKQNVQKKLIDTLSAFKTAYVYETFSGTENNVFSDQTAPLLFKCVAEAPEGGLLASVRNLIHNWNTYLLEDDRRDMQWIINELTAIQNGSTPDLQNEDKPYFEFIIQNNYRKNEFKQLQQIIQSKQSEYKDNPNKLSIWQRAGRIAQKWKNITETQLQIVNADPSLITIISGACVDLVSAASTNISFNGEYTTLSPASAVESTIRILLPGSNTTVAQYHEWRNEEKDNQQKSAELSKAQTELYARIIEPLNDCVNRVSVMESSQKLASQSMSENPPAGLLTKLSMYNTFAIPLSSETSEVKPDSRP